jgi:uncharacterized SAM-binding protein YcdF (DUF218 family)
MEHSSAEPPAHRARRKRLLRMAVAAVLGAALVAAALWSLWIYAEIQHYATTDEARRADAIAVFGAAEYEGRPSPVLRARLDQALLLYRRGLAPLIITLGGSGDPDHSEGGVGEEYLISHGVPESRIIAETQSRSTAASARRLAAIAEANHLRTVLAVSDGTHLFRIRMLCQGYGLEVYTSPRAVGRPIGRWDRATRMIHEIASYAGWKLGLR